MSIGLILISLGLACVVAILIVLILKVNSTNFSKKNQVKSGDDDPYTVQAAQAVTAIFNDEFREELRNRGRLHFEKIIGENAMFLQQDLQLTTSELNEYMKQEITNKLQEEFSKYEQSITDAKNLAIQSINKTQDAIEQQRQMLSKQVVEQLAKDKDRLITNFEQNMAQVINHYVLEAIGNQIDLNDQLDFILSDLEANKKAIIEDIVDGA
jgi:membrane-associated HD superfamily phosphohydrolase